MVRKIHSLERMARAVTDWTGSSLAFLIALLSVLVWLAAGPFVDPPFLNHSYQLIINTGTTIITFLMVFLIQRA